MSRSGSAPILCGRIVTSYCVENRLGVGDDLHGGSKEHTANDSLPRTTTIMSSTSNANSKLDPYTAKAQNNDLTPQEKIDGLKTILSTVKTGMLTSRDKNGFMHARAMRPASPHSNTQLTLVFLANNSSAKFDELENDSHVNVSFYDESSTNWASFSGVAKISQDKALIETHWNPMVAAYFGDLGDGVHKGDVNDPRVSVITVIPEEIRYWLSSQNSVSRTVTTAVSAVTGKGHAPGELRTITKDEIQLTQNLN